jgi:phosphotriesterase-related protein
VDKRPDPGLHRELAQAGALLGYDTFVRSKYKPEQNVWPLLFDLVDDNLADHIAIGLDLAQSSMWRHYDGEPGLVALPDQILPRLYHHGLSETVAAKLVCLNSFIDNPG